MYCLKCGKQIPDDSIFCMYCGTSLSGNHNKSNINSNYLSNNHYVEFDIRDGVLVKYNGRAKVVSVPEGVTELAEKCIMGAEEVILPSTLKVIQRNAFLNCNFNKMVIPDGVEKIYTNIYASEVTLPKDYLGTSGNKSETDCLVISSHLKKLNANPLFIEKIIKNNYAKGDFYFKPFAICPAFSAHPIYLEIKRTEEQKNEWKKRGLCPNCGGSFGFWDSKCKKCGQHK